MATAWQLTFEKRMGLFASEGYDDTAVDCLAVHEGSLLQLLLLPSDLESAALPLQHAVVICDLIYLESSLHHQLKQISM